MQGTIKFYLSFTALSSGKNGPDFLSFSYDETYEVLKCTLVPGAFLDF